MNLKYKIDFMLIFSFRLDQELVRLVEERKARELEEEKLKFTKNHIQVKPIIETVPTISSRVPSAREKMELNEKIEDLLRYEKQKPKRYI